MAKPVSCYFCRRQGLVKDMVKIKTPKGEVYSCPNHPGIEKVKIESKIK